MEHYARHLYTGMTANTGYSIALVFLIWTNLFNFSQGGYTLHYATKKTWDGIKSLCEQNGQQLIKIDSLAQFNDVKHYLNGQSINTDVWIGIRLDASQLPQYVYRFVDGTEPSYYQWDNSVGEPNYQVSDHCIKMESTKSWKYRTNKCSTEMYGLCEDVQTTTTGSMTSTTQESTTTTIATTTTAITTTSQKPTTTDISTAATDSTSITPVSTSSSVSTKMTTIDACECPCGFKMNNLSVHELNALLQEVKNKLQISKTSLSSYVRSKTSASDSRSSSKVIGTVGTLIITLVISIIILPDMMSVLIKTRQIVNCRKTRID